MPQKHDFFIHIDFQKASRELHSDRSYRGHIYHPYSAGDSRAKLLKRAKMHHERAFVIKMPKVIRRMDPESAKYVAYVSGHKIPKGH